MATMQRPARPDAAEDRSEPVERLEIRPSENGGFSVECRRRQKARSGKPHEISSYVEPKTYTFESLAGLIGFLHEEFGGGDDENTEDA